jgi:hypothetical protein
VSMRSTRLSSPIAITGSSMQFMAGVAVHTISVFLRILRYVSQIIATFSSLLTEITALQTATEVFLHWRIPVGRLGLYCLCNGDSSLQTITRTTTSCG